MGLFSAIGGAIKSVCSAVCSCVGKVCSAVGGALSNIGRAASGFVEKLSTIAPPLFPKLDLPMIIEAIGKVIGKIAEFLGIKEPEKDEPEDLGMKAEQAEKKPEDFDSTEEYIKYLHNEVKVDGTKKKELTTEQRAAYTAIGSQLYLNAAKEKLGVDDISPEILVDAAKLKMNAGEIVEYIKQMKNVGLGDQKAMSDYLRGKAENVETAGKVRDSMTAALKEINPEMSDDDIADKICDMRAELSKEES